MTGLILCVARVAAVAVASVAAWAVVAALGQTSPFPPTPLIAVLAILPVNLATLAAVRRVCHARGRRVRDLIAFRPADLLWGLLWLVVLYVPFVATVLAAMFALYGARMFTRFEAVFVPAQYPDFALPVAVTLGVLAVATFAPLNAPAEELAFRGLAQGDLESAGRPVAARLLPSLAFGAQHLFFAPTAAAMLVYGAAFFVWGLGSALICRRQRRLGPLIVSHVLVNLASTLPALILPLALRP